MNQRVRTLTLLLLAAALTGCGGDKSPTTSKATTGSATTDNATAGDPPKSNDKGVNIKVGDTEITATQDQGTDIKAGGVHVQTRGSSSKLPADYPKDVPIYAGAAIKATVLTQQGEGSYGMVQLQTEAPVEKVSEFYRAELKSQGWTEAQYAEFQNEGKAATVIGAKKGARILAIQVTTDKDGATLINITSSTGS